MHRHATLTAWNREEDGTYQAEIEGFTLTVKWRAGSEKERRGFLWKAEGPDDQKAEADEVEEEIENAMVLAEVFVEQKTGGPKKEAADEDESKKDD